MADFLRVLGEWIAFLWPMHIVHEWEESGLYIRGRFRKVVGPGLYFKLPWFMRYIDVSKAVAFIGTNRADVTLKDGRILSFMAIAEVQVFDVEKALNVVEEYQESTAEMLASILSDAFAEIDPERLDPSRRSRLMSSMLKEVQDVAATFGITVRGVRFPTFVLNPRTYRLLSDMAPAASW